MVSFDSSDIDTIIARKFEKGTNFNRMIDTIQWDISQVRFYSQKDTFLMGAYAGNLPLKSGFDYQVFIPATNKTYKITEINEPQREGNCKGKVMCGNVIVSSKLDGNLVSINYDILYLKKINLVGF